MWHRLNNSGDVYKEKSRELRRETRKNRKNYNTRWQKRKRTDISSATIVFDCLGFYFYFYFNYAKTVTTKCHQEK